MSKIQLLTGGAVEESLEIDGVHRIFRYVLNKPTIGVLLLAGLLFFLAAAVLFFGPGLGGGFTAAFLIAIVVGISFFSMASFWGNFTNKTFIAVSEEFLFVGSDERAWRVHWSLVTRESLNMEELQLSRFQGRMVLSAGGQEIDIPLFTPFAYLEDIEALIFEMLKHLDLEPSDSKEQKGDPDEKKKEEMKKEEIADEVKAEKRS